MTRTEPKNAKYTIKSIWSKQGKPLTYSKTKEIASNYHWAKVIETYRLEHFHGIWDTEVDLKMTKEIYMFLRFTLECLVSDLGKLLVIEMIMGVGHDEFFHTESSLGVVLYSQIEVTQLHPALKVCHKPKSQLLLLLQVWNYMYVSLLAKFFFMQKNYITTFNIEGILFQLQVHLPRVWLYLYM